MAGGAAALLSDSLPAMLAVLFALGVQAAFFGPLKYGILPELLGAGELLRGNALVEAGTFAAILLGTIAGGALIGSPSGRAVVGGAGLVVAAAGLLAALAIPLGPAAAPGLRIGVDPVAATVALLRAARRDPPVWTSVLGLSWFWALGATFLAQFPVLAQAEFHAGSGVVTLLLTGFAMGVGAGSMLAGRLAPGGGARVVPAAALLLLRLHLGVRSPVRAAGGVRVGVAGAHARLARRVRRRPQPAGAPRPPAAPTRCRSTP